jgi:hypothetical protein
VPGPHKAGLDDWNAYEIAYSTEVFSGVTSTPEERMGAELPRVPSNTTRPVNETDAVCVRVIVGVIDAV